MELLELEDLPLGRLVHLLVQLLELLWLIVPQLHQENVEAVFLLVALKHFSKELKTFLLERKHF